jgi:hypothetical protein
MKIFSNLYLLKLSSLYHTRLEAKSGGRWSDEGNKVLIAYSDSMDHNGDATFFSEAIQGM